MTGGLRTVLAVAFCFSVGLFALPGAAQVRSDLTGELDIFAAKYFDWLQPRSIREGIEYCGLFGMDGKGNLAAILAQPGNADSCLPGAVSYTHLTLPRILLV